MRQACGLCRISPRSILATLLRQAERPYASSCTGCSLFVSPLSRAVLNYHAYRELSQTEPGIQGGSAMTQQLCSLLAMSLAAAALVAMPAAAQQQRVGD